LTARRSPHSAPQPAQRAAARTALSAPVRVAEGASLAPGLRSSRRDPVSVRASPWTPLREKLLRLRRPDQVAVEWPLLERGCRRTEPASYSTAPPSLAVLPGRLPVRGARETGGCLISRQAAARINIPRERPDDRKEGLPTVRRPLHQQPATASRLVSACARRRCTNPWPAPWPAHGMWTNPPAAGRRAAAAQVAGAKPACAAPLSTAAVGARSLPAAVQADRRDRGHPPPAERAADAGRADELGPPQRVRRGGCGARRRQPPRRTGAVRRRSVGPRCAGSSPERRVHVRPACR
jgi:hypothetical protein